MEIAALVSGGVDSSVVVHLLKEAGYTPTIFYIRIGMERSDGTIDCPAEEDIEITTYIARKYGCRMEVVPLHEEYWDRVVGYTIDAVRRGLTPNPDMMCNRYIKFGCFEEQWGHHFDRIATGHYATTTEIDGQTWLSTAADPVKDQTDFLGQITGLQVAKLLFPIGHLMKHEVRSLAEAAGLPSARRKDSQGLGMSGGPWFVVGKDAAANIVYVSNGYDPETQYGRTIRTAGFHFITADPWGAFDDEREITFKIRHTPDFTRGRIRRVEGGYEIDSDDKIQGIAPGQFAVVYDRDHRLCIGSGPIVEGRTEPTAAVTH